MLKNQNIIQKLRDSGLRPTKQRVNISKVLFDTDRTFHFTINQLKKITEKNVKKKLLWLHYTIRYMRLKKVVM